MMSKTRSWTDTTRAVLTHADGGAAISATLHGLRGWLVVVLVDDSRKGDAPLAICATLGHVDEDGPDYPAFYHVGSPPGNWAPFLPHDVDQIELTRGNMRAVIRLGRLYKSPVGAAFR
jgi:hypothetical protein